MSLDADTRHVVRGNAQAAELRVSRSLYGIEPIAKAAHAFTGRCFVRLDNIGDDVIVTIERKQPHDDAQVLASDMANEILDQMLRAHLKAETEAVRRLILAQAFSRTNLVHPEFDRPLPTDHGSLQT